MKDLKISNLINQELERQTNSLNLIASENYAPKEVLQAQANILSSKYAEGYPGKRYYAGCEIVDEVENLAIERAKKIFCAEYANVQPHSGSQANMAVYKAFLKPGDIILAMSLAEGGHLTHGHPTNFSGEIYKFIHYGLDKNGYLDYEDLEKKALEYKPKLIIAGASAYPRKIDFKIFKKISDKVGAVFMVDMAHIAGLIATGEHESPIGLADVITSTTHKTLRGPRGGLILAKEEYGNAINKAVMPGIQGGPFMNVIASKAVAFGLALDKEFKDYQEQIIKNAQALANELKKLGFKLITGGTDNHLILIDLRNKNITGREAEKILEEQNIIVNRNSIPNDPQKPLITSGLRLGTPALTSRGLKEAEFRKIANLIDQALAGLEVKNKVLELISNYPIY